MIFKKEYNKIEIIFNEDDDADKVERVIEGVDDLKDEVMGYKKGKKPSHVIITEDRMAQRIVLEVLLHYVNDITIKDAKNISQIISTQIRCAFKEIKEQGLKITDEQANSLAFWLYQIINSGKDFNQK